MALETIDALLPPAAKALILPLLEDLPYAAREARWKSAGIAIEVGPVGSVLSSLIGSKGPIAYAPWTRMCAMYLAAKNAQRSCLPALEGVPEDPDRGLQQARRWALLRMRSRREGEGDDEMLSIVEKVLILKAAPIFSETPDNVLADVAALVEEASFDTDQVVFHKGEPGDSLYVIVSGSVKVWDGDRLLNELREGEAFGELALLDPEPRLATVKAVEPCNLLRLDAPSFREILESQPEVSAAIIRVITKYLRSQLQVAREATARLRTLESLGSLEPTPES
jgi:hypothetical protein